MGVCVFIFILLMFQMLRLTEFVLVHGVSIFTIIEIMLYLSISFLPVILPMSLLFAIMSTFNRLSADSEIIALRALGLNIWHISFPALALSSAVALVSAQTSFTMAPWGNRRFELLINEIAHAKVGATIKEGVFSEGFFNLVVYANKVDEAKGLLNQVFIYDERNENTPLTIIAQEGKIEHNNSRQGQEALLRLSKGNIHSTVNDTYTKIDFEKYDINLFEPIEVQEKQKSIQSLTLHELQQRKNDTSFDKKYLTKVTMEFHRRIAISFGCLIFGFLGVGLGISKNRRSGKSSSLVMCLVVLVTYWLAFVGVEGLSQNHVVPANVGVWGVNSVFGLLSFLSIYRHRR